MDCETEGDFSPYLPLPPSHSHYYYLPIFIFLTTSINYLSEKVNKDSTWKQKSIWHNNSKKTIPNPKKYILPVRIR